MLALPEAACLMAILCESNHCRAAASRFATNTMSDQVSGAAPLKPAVLHAALHFQQSSSKQAMG